MWYRFSVFVFILLFQNMFVGLEQEHIALTTCKNRADESQGEKHRADESQSEKHRADESPSEKYRADNLKYRADESERKKVRFTAHRKSFVKGGT
jgi:hypothetical protein